MSLVSRLYTIVFLVVKKLLHFLKLDGLVFLGLKMREIKSRPEIAQRFQVWKKDLPNNYSAKMSRSE